MQVFDHGLLVTVEPSGKGRWDELEVEVHELP
jgi:hypothetical protein